MAQQDTSAITGKEYKAFMRSESAWPNGYTVDDELIKVDGKKFDSDIDEISDDSVVVIECGDVYQNGKHAHSLQNHYDSWFSNSELAMQNISISVFRANFKEWLYGSKDAIKTLTPIEEQAAQAAVEAVAASMVEFGLSPSSDDEDVGGLNNSIVAYLIQSRKKQANNIV